MKLNAYVLQIGWSKLRGLAFGRVNSLKNETHRPLKSQVCHWQSFCLKQGTYVYVLQCSHQQVRNGDGFPVTKFQLESNEL